MCDGKVEVEEKLPLSLEERAQVVGQELEEGALAIGREQGVPVLVPPVAVVAQADVFHGAFQAVVLRDGQRQRLQAVGGGDDTAVAVGLLHEIVMSLDEAAVITVELLVPLHRTEISGREEAGHRS
jgi:hypothetical protein